MDISQLVNLTARAWAMETLAHMHAGVPGRQAPLVAATGAGRTAFGESLAHLMVLGLVERNPGHGHPLRPEFRLTATGQVAASMAHQICFVVADGAERSLLRRRWAVPVLTVTHQPRRFSEVRQALGRVTDRALSQALTQLEDHGWLLREIDPAARPIRALYRTDGPGRGVSSIASAQIVCADQP